MNPAQTGTVRVTVVPFRARPVRLRIAGRLLVTNTVNLAVAIGFAAMGVAIIALADQPDMTRGTAAQGWISRQLTTAFLRIQHWASPVPEAVQALLLFLVVGGLVAATLTGRRRGAAAATPLHDDPADPRSDAEQLTPVEGHPAHGPAIGPADRVGGGAGRPRLHSPGLRRRVRHTVRPARVTGAAVRQRGITVLPIVMQISADRLRIGAKAPFLLDDGTVSQAYDAIGTGMHEDLPGHGFVLVDACPSMWTDPAELLGIVRDTL